MNAVETAGLTKTYRGRPVVDGVDLAVPEGACMLLVGANGAGKSTTLQMLMNLLSPTAGEARVLGCDSRRLGAQIFRQIGYASENQVLPPRLDSTQFFNLLRHWYPEWDGELEADARRRLRIPEDRALHKLSRGEQMKACIAAALPFRPRLLVMDEPLSGLDPLSREDLVRLLVEQAEHASMLISTHDLAEIERLATHVAVLHEGKLILQGEVETILQRFRNVTVRVEAPSRTGPTPESWLNLCWEGPFLTFTHEAGADDDLTRELERAYGAGVRPAVSPMNLAAVTSAVMRARADAPKH